MKTTTLGTIDNAIGSHGVQIQHHTQPHTHYSLLPRTRPIQAHPATLGPSQHLLFLQKADEEQHTPSPQSCPELGQQRPFTHESVALAQHCALMPNALRSVSGTSTAFVAAAASVASMRRDPP